MGMRQKALIIIHTRMRMSVTVKRYDSTGYNLLNSEHRDL